MTLPADGAENLRRATSWIFADARPERLGVALSGGGDSMALLDLLAGQAGALGIPVRAVTVNHNLRPEAADEAEYVARHCAARGIAHEILHWDGQAASAGGGNLAEMAREARYALIADWATVHRIDAVALGHTRDDQAENLLLRLRRAAGVDGLATMARRFEARDIVWLRPLLGAGRAELRHYLQERGIGWCEDPGNTDPAHERARARQILAALAPLGIDAAALARTSDNLRAARGALDHYTRQEARTACRVENGDLLIAPPPPVPAEIVRRLLVGGLQFVGGGAHGPRAASLAEMEEALRGGGVFTLAGCVITRDSAAADNTAHPLRIAREWNAVKDLRGPTGRIWDGRWHLTGPHAPDLEIGALGEGVTDCPDWRASGLPRRSLLASPAIWRGNALVSAPLAGLSNGWRAHLAKNRHDFAQFLLSR